jgi:hypothetical protein
MCVAEASVAIDNSAVAAGCSKWHRLARAHLAALKAAWSGGDHSTAAVPLLPPLRASVSGFLMPAASLTNLL